MNDMKAICPYCNKELHYMDMQTSADLNAIIQLTQTFGRHSNVVMGYCYLFGVSPLHLQAKKLRLLLEELKRLFDAEGFTFEKRRYAIDHAGIAEALDIMIKRNFTKHLNNHNYLKQIMIGIAEREATNRSRQNERDLRKKEAGLMVGNRQQPKGDMTQSCPPLAETPRAQLTPEQIEANKRQIRETLKKIGG